jgi:excisionase family DNA binding protein
MHSVASDFFLEAGMGVAEVVVAPLLHRRINAAQRLGISVRLLDSLLAERALRSLKVGRRRLVSEESLLEFIKKREKSGE